MYSLFQIMTLESWSMGIVRPDMEEFPLAWAFFVPFVIITSFAVLNRFIALIENSMQSIHPQHRELARAQGAPAHDGHEALARRRDTMPQELRQSRASVSTMRFPESAKLGAGR